MKAIDFEYDNELLSDYGFMICSFDDNGGVETVSAGSEIEFTTVILNHGRKHKITDSEYTEALTAKFDIMKNDCDTSDNHEITDEEFRRIMRWLNRKKFLHFRIIDEDNDIDEYRYFNASFNLQKIFVGSINYGIRLTVTTDAPFAYGETVKITKTVPDGTTQLNPYNFIVEDISDEIGYTYPNKIRIVLSSTSTGNLYINNRTIDCQTVINNCSGNEIIEIDCENKIITTNKSTHKIYNDFNFKFLKLQNTTDSRINNISVSLPCLIEISYIPIIKNGII